MVLVPLNQHHMIWNQLIFFFQLTRCLSRFVIFANYHPLSCYLIPNSVNHHTDYYAVKHAEDKLHQIVLDLDLSTVQCIYSMFNPNDQGESVSNDDEIDSHNQQYMNYSQHHDSQHHPSIAPKCHSLTLNQILDFQFFLEKITYLKIKSNQDTNLLSPMNQSYVFLNCFKGLQKLEVTECRVDFDHPDHHFLRQQLIHLTFARSFDSFKNILYLPNHHSQDEQHSIANHHDAPSNPELFTWPNLTYLCATLNPLTHVDGIGRFTALTNLDLSHNRIEELPNLSDCIALTCVDLSFNRISSLADAVHKMGNIQVLSLTGNKINSTSGIEQLMGLVYINLSKNIIAHLSAIGSLRKLPFLQNLNLADNPITQITQYRLLVYFNLNNEGLVLDGCNPSNSEQEIVRNRKRNIGNSTKLDTKIDFDMVIKEWGGILSSSEVKLTTKGPMDIDAVVKTININHSSTNKKSQIDNLNSNPDRRVNREMIQWTNQYEVNSYDKFEYLDNSKNKDKSHHAPVQETHKSSLEEHALYLSTKPPKLSSSTACKISNSSHLVSTTNHELRLNKVCSSSLPRCVGVQYQDFKPLNSNLTTSASSKSEELTGSRLPETSSDEESSNVANRLKQFYEEDGSSWLLIYNAYRDQTGYQKNSSNNLGESGLADISGMIPNMQSTTNNQFGYNKDKDHSSEKRPSLSSPHSLAGSNSRSRQSHLVEFAPNSNIELSMPSHVPNAKSPVPINFCQRAMNPRLETSPVIVPPDFRSVSSNAQKINTNNLSTLATTTTSTIIHSCPYYNHLQYDLQGGDHLDQSTSLNPFIFINDPLSLNDSISLFQGPFSIGSLGEFFVTYWQDHSWIDAILIFLPESIQFWDTMIGKCLNEFKNVNLVNLRYTKDDQSHLDKNMSTRTLPNHSTLECKCYVDLTFLSDANDPNSDSCPVLSHYMFYTYEEIAKLVQMLQGLVHKGDKIRGGKSLTS